MKISAPITKLLSLSAAALLAVAMTTSALAATASGTVISNSATVTYQVGGASHSPVSSNVAQFVVDTKVDLTVTTSDAATVKVVSGATAQVLVFSVTNTGNATQDVALTATPLAGGSGKFGGTDSFNANAVAVYVESGANAGYQAAQDTSTYIDELGANGAKTVYIVADMPLGLSNGAIASYYLTAEARAGGNAAALGGALTETVGADSANGVDIVFADGQGAYTAGDALGDAKYSGQDDYEAQAVVLIISTTSTVLSDPYSIGTGAATPQPIPGGVAVVEYTITVNNSSGALSATNIVVTDDLSAEAATLTFNPDGYGVGKGIQVTAPNLYGGAATPLSIAADTDEGDFGVTAANTVTVMGISLAPSETATVKFRVTIQ